MPVDVDLTAWHEAGHAVHRVTARLPFRYVTIRPRTAGTTGLIKAWPAWRNSWKVTMSAAMGPAAEARRLVEREGLGLDEAIWYVETSEAAVDDRRCVEGWGFSWPVAAAVASLRLDALWPAISSVAEGLTQRRTLRHAEVADLCRDSLPGWPHGLQMSIDLTGLLGS